MSNPWHGLKPSANSQLGTKTYTDAAARPAANLLEVDKFIAKRDEPGTAWIPGVEFFRRTIYPQRHRGIFGELARLDEGKLGEIGMWPRQWSAARMFAGTAKGFHIHPPHIPSGTAPEAWFKKLFVDEPRNYSQRPYDQEQWDAMFFLQGNVEMILVDERAGLPRTVMRFLIEGDDQRGPNNAAVVIPPGVAHALRVEGSRDVVTVYGTTTTFKPEAEGRIAAGVENAPLPEEWQKYLG
jgi:dTDP-4-dehydrorhamnose 3,5-epimerase-like enzyme